MKRRYVEAATEVIRYADKDVILTSAGEPDPQCLGDYDCGGDTCDDDDGNCNDVSSECNGEDSGCTEVGT